MNEPVVAHATEVEREIGWTVKFFELIQRIHHTKETKVKTVNLLVEEEARIQTEQQELVPR